MQEQIESARGGLGGDYGMESDSSDSSEEEVSDIGLLRFGMLDMRSGAAQASEI